MKLPENAWERGEKQKAFRGRLVNDTCCPNNCV